MKQKITKYDSMWDIFMKWLAKINKKRDLETIDKAKQEKIENQRVETPKNDIQEKP